MHGSFAFPFDYDVRAKRMAQLLRIPSYTEILELSPCDLCKDHKAKAPI